MTITIAQVISVFGIKGELKVYLHTDFPVQRFKSGATVYLKHDHAVEATPFTIISFREDAPVGYLSLQGIEDRTSAEKWVGAWITFDETKRKPLPKDTFYLPQLIGCQVEDEQGHPLGEVTEVITSTAQPLLRIVREGHPIVLLPFVGAWISHVLVTNKRIVVKRGEGMFE